ncbi:MAG: hypothetical protein R3C10_22050 [Pirellulales bacterium]|nr:phenylacetate--CoA ligase family protein [Planctomycetales bacterium]
MILDDVKRELVGRCTFPATNWLYNRRRLRGIYGDLVYSDAWPAQMLEETQLQQLRRVLAYAQRWCPFYAERLRHCHVDPKDIRKLSDVEHIPPLTRHDLIQHRAELVDRRLSASVEAAERQARPPGAPIPLAPFRRHRLVRNTSTGSTGTPVVVYEDGSTTAMTWAHEWRLKKWFGLAPGEREARFARVSTEFVANSKSLRARQLLWNQLVLPGINLAEADFALCLERIRTFRPRILFGITSALTGFAKYVQAQAATADIRPAVVITWASPVYDHERALLEQTFDCPVANVYGSREVGHVASTCPHGRMHIHQENFHVEVRHDPSSGGAGNSGQILITPLFPTPMPLVRYEIGDVAELTPSDCPCGRQHPLLRNLLGRTTEIFTTASGRAIPPNFWCRAFMGNDGSQHVDQFQVVLERSGGLRFRVVRRPDYTPETEAGLRRYLGDQLQDEIPMEFEYVDAIAPQPSGKIPMVIDQREAETAGASR